MDTIISDVFFEVDEIHHEIAEAAGDDFLEVTESDPVNHSLEEAEIPINPREKPPDWDWKRHRFEWEVVVPVALGVGILGAGIYYGVKDKT